jgi:hypothetical protein
MTTQAQTQFPGFAPQIRRLVEDHLKLTDEPLLWAVYYKPQREEQDIFLFEVVGNFGGDGIDPDRELFEVTYTSKSGFDMDADQQLHLVLTNPHEFETAVRENWELLAELRQAIDAGNYQTVHIDPMHKHLAEMVNAN